MISLRRCFFGKEKSLDISLLFGHLLLSQKIALNDISSKLVKQRQKQLISVVMSYPHVFVELNYAFSVNSFHYFCYLFIIVFLHIICSVDLTRRATTESRQSSCTHFLILCVLSILMKCVKDFLISCLVITQIIFEHLW